MSACARAAGAAVGQHHTSCDSPRARALQELLSDLPASLKIDILRDIYDDIVATIPFLPTCAKDKPQQCHASCSTALPCSMHENNIICDEAEEGDDEQWRATRRPPLAASPPPCRLLPHVSATPTRHKSRGRSMGVPGAWPGRLFRVPARPDACHSGACARVCMLCHAMRIMIDHRHSRDNKLALEVCALSALGSEPQLLYQRLHSLPSSRARAPYK